MENANGMQDIFYDDVFIHLANLYFSNPNSPKVKELILELFREFDYNFCYNFEAPEKVRIHLKGSYSHRLIKTTFEKIGYRTSKKPICTGFTARKL